MRIEILYPEVCCLYGDLVNAEYLLRCVPGAQLIKTPLGEKPAFLSGGADMAFLCSMPEYAQPLVRDKLAAFLPELEAYIERGGAFLATGNALEVFFEYIEDTDGKRTDMLGLFPLHAKRDFLNRYNSLYLGRLGDIDIVGFKSQFCHAYGEGVSPLFETVRGCGINPGVMAEGVRRNNFMGTYVLGPLTVLNPPFAKYLLSLLGIENPVLAFEDAAFDAYNLRLSEFSEPDRGFSY